MSSRHERTELLAGYFVALAGLELIVLGLVALEPGGGGRAIAAFLVGLPIGPAVVLGQAAWGLGLAVALAALAISIRVACRADPERPARPVEVAALIVTALGQVFLIVVLARSASDLGFGVAGLLVVALVGAIPVVVLAGCRKWLSATSLTFRPASTASAVALAGAAAIALAVSVSNDCARFAPEHGVLTRWEQTGEGALAAQVLARRLERCPVLDGARSEEVQRMLGEPDGRREGRAADLRYELGPAGGFLDFRLETWSVEIARNGRVTSTELSSEEGGFD